MEEANRCHKQIPGWYYVAQMKPKFKNKIKTWVNTYINENYLDMQVGNPSTFRVINGVEYDIPTTTIRPAEKIYA